MLQAGGVGVGIFPKSEKVLIGNFGLGGVALHGVNAAQVEVRDRREDIILLVRYFVQEFSRRQNKTVAHIPADIMDTLANYPWPGKIRELENLIERAVLLSPSKELHVPLAELKEFTPNSSVASLALPADTVRPASVAPRAPLPPPASQLSPKKRRS